MAGSAFLRLTDIANDNYGYITVTAAKEVGVSPVRLAQMGLRGQLQRVAQGLYRVPTYPRGPLDPYMEATLWPRGGGVLSHATALDLLDLSDVNPVKIHITVPVTYRNRRHIKPGAYELHRRNLDPRDITRHEGIPVVTAYRAILDGLEGGLGPALINQAISNARKRGLISPHQVADLRARTRRPRR